MQVDNNRANMTGEPRRGRFEKSVPSRFSHLPRSSASRLARQVQLADIDARLRGIHARQPAVFYGLAVAVAVVVGLLVVILNSL